MSTVEQIERAEERRKRRVAFLFLAALLILLLGLIGRSWFVDPLEGDTDVLSHVDERSGLRASVPRRSSPSSGADEVATANDGWVAGGPTTTAGVAHEGDEADSSDTSSAATSTPAAASTSGNPNQGNQGNDGSQGNAGNPGGGNPGEGNPGGGPGATPPTLPQTFGIRGDVTGLYPGFVGDLDLTLTNPHRFRIVVTDLIVQVGTPTMNGAPVPSCTGHLTVDPWQGTRAIATLSTARQPVTARFSSASTDVCQNVTYPLTYGGTAIRENQS